ncbi:MAG: hypothetical protein ACTHMI_08075 [Mucilaginibacter sp.]
MVLKFLKQRWQKITLAVFSGLVLLILIAALVLNSYWSPILESKVKDIVTTSSDGLYKADFSAAELHILRGTIAIFNITLKPDTAVYNARKKRGLAPNNLVELHIKKLVLSHIHPFKLYFKKELNIGRILLYNPELKVSYQLNHTRDTVSKDHRTAWQKISKSLHYIHIGDILMGDVKFTYNDYSGNKLSTSQFQEMNLSAHDLLIDSATQTDKSRLLYCKDITGEINNYKGETANGLYTYSVKSIKLSTSKSQLDLTGISLKPASTEKFFTKSHKDRFTLSLDSAQLNNFDFLSYHKYRTLTASSLFLHDGAFQVFANPNHAKTKEDKIKSFPNVAMNRLKIDLKIDTVNVNRLDVTYHEFNVKSKKTGTLTFNRTSAQALNVTNNAAALKKNNIITLMINSNFMNRGKLNATYHFNLTDKDALFDFKGSIGHMDLQAINPAAMPLGMFKVNSGTLSKFDFDIKASRAGGKGRVELLYDNVKVGLLQADTNADKLKKKFIATLFANIFIIKHNNPNKEGEQPRIAYVTYIRRPEDAFFKTMWRTLLSGIKPSVGLDKKTEQSVARMKDQQTIRKQERKLKKEQRKQRREERKRKREQKEAENP